MPATPGLRTFDGLSLHLQRWDARGPARGTVQIVHGLGEHIGRYEHVAAALNQGGWHVAGHDLRGHGRSGGPRGTIPHPQALLGDLALVMDHLRRPGRHVLLGHSLGGLIAARFVAEGLQHDAARWQRDVDALVLSSPALQVSLRRPQKMLLGVASRLAPRLRLGNGLRPSWLSRDPAVVHAYRHDPLVHDRVTPALVRFILDAGAFVSASAARWRVRTLLMWSGADRCVRPAGSAAFAAAASQAVVTARPFARLYHEIFNEPEQRIVLSELRQWLDNT